MSFDVNDPDYQSHMVKRTTLQHGKRLLKFGR